MLTVHIAQPPSAAGRFILEEALVPAVAVTYGPDLPPTPSYDILVHGRPTPASLTASDRLRAVIVPWAGIPPETLALIQANPPLTLHNLHYNAQPVAELTLTLLLAAAKFVVPLDTALRQHDWTPRYDPPPSMLMAGKTVLILGYGAIGQAVAPLCQALSMNVLAIRRRVDLPYTDEQGVTVQGPDNWRDLLPTADVLLVTLPLTTTTEDMVDAAVLAALPKGAVLVNVGRGPIVNAHALYESLRDGHLRAAALDVWYSYPTSVAERANTPPAPVPFHELPNIVMSPHRAGTTDEKEATRWQQLATMLNTAATNHQLPNRVDLTQGY